MSARRKLEECIRELEDSLGAPLAPKVGADGTARASRPALELVDSAIATLEASLSLRPGEAVGVTGGAKGGSSKETKWQSQGSSKPRNKGKGNRSADGSGSGKGGGGAEKAARVSSISPSATLEQQPEGTKVDFRVGLIKNVWKHESADKLYCEEIDVGEDAPRNIASGLALHYSLEEMKGRRVVVMCNLKPRNLKGFKSHGMVVCAVETLEGGNERVELLAPPEGAAVGENLTFEGVSGGPFAPLSAAQMEKKKVLEKLLPDLTTDGEGTVRWREHALVSACGPCKAPVVRNGAVR